MQHLAPSPLLLVVGSLLVEVTEHAAGPGLGSLKSGRSCRTGRPSKKRLAASAHGLPRRASVKSEAAKPHSNSGRWNAELVHLGVPPQLINPLATSLVVGVMCGSDGFSPTLPGRRPSGSEVL